MSFCQKISSPPLPSAPPAVPQPNAPLSSIAMRAKPEPALIVDAVVGAVEGKVIVKLEEREVGAFIATYSLPEFYKSLNSFWFSIVKLFWSTNAIAA